MVLIPTLEDRVENILCWTINFRLLLFFKNIANLCGTKNIPINSLCDIAHCIISVGSVFRKKSNIINVSVCGLISRDEGWSVNMVLINEVNEILKYQCNINGFTFIFQHHVKLTNSITMTLIQAILAILHLALLRMFLPSTDMISCKPQFRQFVLLF